MDNVGSGLYAMLIFAIVAVFISGLMIGRTPEYLGKKIESFEMKMVSISVLITRIVGSGRYGNLGAVAGRQGGMLNPGAHGFSEVLYAFSSAANNNGSAFAGLSANTPFYNMMLARPCGSAVFCAIVPVLAIAGSLAQETSPSSRHFAHPRPAVRDFTDCHGIDCRCLDLFPGAGAWVLSSNI